MNSTTHTTDLKAHRLHRHEIIRVTDLPPTQHRGPRVQARWSKTIYTIPYDFALSTIENSFLAAKGLADLQNLYTPHHYGEVANKDYWFTSKRLTNRGEKA